MQKQSKKILIVDSSAAFRGSLGMFIKGLGHQVFEGTTGPEAIAMASSLRPDLIMMDVQLPGLSGDDVTARLKSHSSTRNIPVVINTGWTTTCNVAARVERALNAGAAEILYKPLQWTMLRAVLRSHLLA